MTILSKYAEIEDLGGGKFRSTISLKPSAYFESGAWRRMALDFLDSGIAERPHLVTAAPMMVTVAPDGLRRLHPTRELDRYLEIGAPFIKVAGVWQKAPLGAPIRSANLLNWTTANANMYVAHGGHFVKLAILLKNGWIPEGGQFAFPVGISGLTRSGGQILADGVPVAQLRAPHVEDLDDPDDQRPVDWQFVSLSGQPYVLFTLPSLAGMGRPLIDPTLTLQPDATAGLDTRIKALTNEEGFNFGAATSFGVGNVDISTGNTNRTLIKFDLTDLPSDAVISSTTLSIYATTDYSSNARTYRVFRQKRAWVEGTRTGADDNPATGATRIRYDTTNNWQTAGGFGADDCEQTDIGSRAFTATETLNEFKDFSLTPTSKADLDLGNGWMVKADTESSDGYMFASSDNVTAADRPKLVVEYTIGAALPQRVVNQAVNRANTY